MRKKDTFDVLVSTLAAIADAIAIYLGFTLAYWVRFYSGWIPLFDGLPDRIIYFYGGGLATILFIVIFRTLGLYRRPQIGTFVDKVPRLTRAIGWGILLTTTLAFVVRTDPPISRLTLGISFFTIFAFVILERWALFHAEAVLARHKKAANRILIIGTDAVALRLKNALEAEPCLRNEVIGLIQPDERQPDRGIPSAWIIGKLSELVDQLDRQRIDQLIVADSALAQSEIINIIILCQKRLIEFQLVPDIFRVLTSEVEIEVVNGIPLLGIGKWPLDYFWNRLRKRLADIAGAMVGLIISMPIVAIAAFIIKRQSAGPVFYRQERCGEGGETFILYKLRTMHLDAEKDTGPVWAKPNDNRRIPAGKLLRQFNLDELPQFWNVLKGEMSLVGPRPERPFFVDQFKEGLDRYMSRHVSKPGMTGWAQVNGLRGDSSIEERLKYDLYYLENWSMSFDFKIIAMTFFRRKNAY